MSRSSARLERLLMYFDRKYGGKSNAVSAKVISKGYVYLLTSGRRSFGEKAASKIALQEGLPANYFEPAVAESTLLADIIKTSVERVIKEGRANGEIEN